MRTSRGRRGRDGSVWCRAGCARAETIAHIIQSCPVTKGGRILRHHAVVKLLATALELRGFVVYREVSIVAGEYFVRPDLIVAKGEGAWVLDVQVVSPGAGLAEINRGKKRKYGTAEVRGAVEALTGKGFQRVIGVTLSWKGIWCLQSARDLRELRIGRKVLEWATERVIRGSHMSWTRWNQLRRGRDGGVY